MGGKRLRLRRFFWRGDNRLVLFPLDHGVSCGPVSGLVELSRVVSYGVRSGADGVVLHKGMLACLGEVEGRLPGIFLHLSASTQLGPSFHGKVLVGSVNEALQRGADGVSVHVNLGDDAEPEMLRDLGKVGEACFRWGLPLLVMIYVRGAHAPKPVTDEAIAHAARVAGELGADVIKIPAPKDPEVMDRIARCVPVPVVMAGGAKERDEAAFLERIQAGLRAGLAGVAVGRNVFQHRDPEGFLRTIVGLVHGERAAREAGT
ncbi:fructose-bisphosphate aldolase, class I [Desulfacinum hydrothermale DSM 13146]|uniref:Fructose-bisphosphate aldolase, class I n=1 Tax=Desulfacinum hydrothermale DSM 13146 TaxID=1121390 RepID=A0A1W1XLW0_9BACT|nr:2-amino-3,7-dideoxy-D-threo-hept-6-ulosonate synthase [Desulfacinum hydrothermale]SMC24817.1 fructose-bisphosphate aldolase, class I [Desulfacinum hydrothermale DSM 13146]